MYQTYVINIKTVIKIIKNQIVDSNFFQFMRKTLIVSFIIIVVPIWVIITICIWIIWSRRTRMWWSGCTTSSSTAWMIIPSRGWWWRSTIRLIIPRIVDPLTILFLQSLPDCFLNFLEIKLIINFLLHVFFLF